MLLCDMDSQNEAYCVLAINLAFKQSLHQNNIRLEKPKIDVLQIKMSRIVDILGPGF